jgi:2-oxoisovalerate dehydrogenase E1 component
LPDIDDETLARFAADPEQDGLISNALLVRAVETALLDLFGKGKLHGTIHTCVGQELTGIVVGRELKKGDFVTSNHRCHGHFIAATGNWQGLVDEIVGNRDGVCGGIGSSQHLYSPNFLSNGQQGGLVPVGAGIALDRKRNRAGNIVVSFVGEGTLGEGILYETLNLAALWSLPQLIVCENNFYSQSTPQSLSVAGSIVDRARAFGIEAFEASIWDPAGLQRAVGHAMSLVRSESRPAFLQIKAYRLNPHSKGDDNRSRGEIEWFRQRDPLTVALKQSRHASQYDMLRADVERYVAEAVAKPSLGGEKYWSDQLPRATGARWRRLEEAPSDQRMVQQFNAFYEGFLQRHPNALFIGEDIADPYGGAFKVSAGLQSKFGDRVLTTPISEAAITGLGLGLAVAGNRPIVEVMFGDFMTLAFDQILNNASKFFHMYNKNVVCPLIVRTPMGGRRGYGPTHSQSLEKFFVGMDNILVLSTNSLVDVASQLAGLSAAKSPAIIFENKIDYTLRQYAPPEGICVEVNDECPFPTVAVRFEGADPTVTLVAYGGMARFVADQLFKIFEDTNLVPELIVPIALHPVDVAAIAESAARTGKLAVIEEGSSFGGLGAEIVAAVLETTTKPISTVRIGSRPVPIPSVPALEREALPGIDTICSQLRSLQAG